MAPTRFDETTISLSSGLTDDVFTTSTRVQTFDGYLAVYQEAEEESDEEGAERQAAEAQKLLKSGSKIAFEKPFRKAVTKTPFSGATRQGKSHSRNSGFLNTFSHPPEGPENAVFRGLQVELI